MQSQPKAQAPLILVVEDDEFIRELVVTRLSLAGYRTAAARDGMAGLAQARTMRPSAIILDINMPHMSGLQVLSQLALDNGLRTIPVLMLTARGAVGDVQEALRGGAKDYLTKPFDDQMLLKRVARLLRSARPSGPTTQATMERSSAGGAGPSDDVEMI